ncbi:MAG TPA: electron transport complex subunit RsxA [bacterium]|nr:electron transport complex subunit RsxA [bacterium]HPN95281.1 electron transport complex subunit RsxA [bacterium]
MNDIVVLVIGAIFVNNFVLARFLGICPFVGVSKRVGDAVGMGMAVIFVMILASVASWFTFFYVLTPLNMEYMTTIAFILIIASLVQFVENVIKKMAPALYKSLGIYLPLITTNCAVLGIALLNVQNGYTLTQTVLHAVGASVGFTMALVLLAGIRERLERADIPPSLKGAPITFITSGLLAIAFMGFIGMV